MKRPFQAPTEPERAAYLAECDRINRHIAGNWIPRPATVTGTMDSFVDPGAAVRESMRSQGAGVAHPVHMGSPDQVPVSGRLPTPSRLPGQTPAKGHPPPRPPTNRALTQQEMMKAQSFYMRGEKATPGLPTMPAFDPTGIPGNSVRLKAPNSES